MGWGGVSVDLITLGAVEQMVDATQFYMRL